MLKKTLMAVAIAVTALATAAPEFALVANAAPIAQLGTGYTKLDPNVQTVAQEMFIKRRGHHGWNGGGDFGNRHAHVGGDWGNRHWRMSGDWRFHDRFHDRFRYRYGDYRYYHNGWWYGSPWWVATIPLVAPRIYAAPRYSGDAHVNWCLDHYRSYNPATDTFTGYDGYQHRCSSPFV